MVLASVHLQLQAEYGKATVVDHVGADHEVHIAFTPGWLRGRSFDPPTAIDRIVTYALDPTGDCSCEWHMTGRIARRDEQYGNSLCLFHGVSTDEPKEMA